MEDYMSHITLAYIFCLFLVDASWSETRLYWWLFQSTRTDQNSSTKFYETLRCQIEIEAFGTGKETKKVVPFFQRHTIPGETKGSHF